MQQSLEKFESSNGRYGHSPMYGPFGIGVLDVQKTFDYCEKSLWI